MQYEEWERRKTFADILRKYILKLKNLEREESFTLIELFFDYNTWNQYYYSTQQVAILINFCWKAVSKILELVYNMKITNTQILITPKQSKFFSLLSGIIFNWW